MRTRRRVGPGHNGILLGTVALTLVGCAGDPTAPTAPEVAGGGQERVLDYERFVQAVAPVFAQHGCNATGDCHGGGIRGAFALSPDSDPDLRFDFEQAAEQVDDLVPERSALLLKPLAENGGGAPHGSSAFADTTDAGYRAILAWIEAGELRP